MRNAPRATNIHRIHQGDLKRRGDRGHCSQLVFLLRAIYTIFSRISKNVPLDSAGASAVFPFCCCQFWINGLRALADYGQIRTSTVRDRQSLGPRDFPR
jgi:hypothetical protein